MRDITVEQVSEASLNEDVLRDVVSLHSESNRNPQEQTKEVAKAIGKIKKILNDWSFRGKKSFNSHLQLASNLFFKIKMFFSSYFSLNSGFNQFQIKS